MWRLGRVSLLLLLFSAPPLFAADVEPEELFADLAFEADAELAAQRGGMRLSDTLDISFGIERQILINGELQTSFTLRIDSLAAVIASTNMANELPPPITLVQNGNGNVFASFPAMGGGLPATVVQNSLDRQSIETINVINATLPNLTAMRQMGLEATLRNFLPPTLAGR